MEGYTKLATLMGSEPRLAIFRRFMSANMLNLLYLSAELMYIQSELADIIQDDRDSGDPRRIELEQWFARLKESHNTPDGQQYRKVLELRDKLKEYNKALFTCHRLYRLPSATRQQLRDLNAVIRDPRVCKYFFHDLEGEAWHEDYGSDMTTLIGGIDGGDDACHGWQYNADADDEKGDGNNSSGSCRKSRTSSNDHESSMDPITNFVQGRLLTLYHDYIGDRIHPEIWVKDQFLRASFPAGFKRYSSARLSMIVNVIKTTLSALLPSLAIFILAYLRLSANARIIAIAGLMIVFNIVMAVVARARGSDFFAASAAFAAVVAVFVGGNPVTTCVGVGIDNNTNTTTNMSSFSLSPPPSH